MVNFLFTVLTAALMLQMFTEYLHVWSCVLDPQHERAQDRTSLLVPVF